MKERKFFGRIYVSSKTKKALPYIGVGLVFIYFMISIEVLIKIEILVRVKLSI